MRSIRERSLNSNAERSRITQSTQLFCTLRQIAKDSLNTLYIYIHIYVGVTRPPHRFRLRQVFLAAALACQLRSHILRECTKASRHASTAKASKRVTRVGSRTVSNLVNGSSPMLSAASFMSYEIQRMRFERNNEARTRLTTAAHHFV